MSNIISTVQADGSTLVHNTETGKAYRFPSEDEWLSTWSDYELETELWFGSESGRIAVWREQARRGEAHALKMLIEKGLVGE